MTNAEILGNRLFELRKEARLSQEEFADKIGVSRQAVSKWERGEALPDTDNLITIAKLFKVSLDSLILNEIKNEDFAEDLSQIDSEETAILAVANDNPSVEATESSNSAVVVQPLQVVVDVPEEKEKAEYYSYDETPATKKRRFLRLLHNLPYPFLVTIAYLFWGFLANDNSGWSIGWTLFITIPVYYSLIDCFRMKQFTPFCYPILVAFVYCFMGMAWGMWHPYWVLFITVPIYYGIAEAIDR